MAPDYIDNYCERLEPGLWAEPLNVLTNIAFFLAVFFVYRLARQQDVLDFRAITLTLLLAVIGLGSTLFHTLATYWAMLSDTLPILLFQIAFLLFYARGVMVLSWPSSIILFCAFVICVYGFGTLPGEWMNGSLSYAPAFIFLGGLGIWHRFHVKHEPAGLLLAALVFAVSLALRSLDLAVCNAFPWGLHFLWHILNGFVLYLAVRAFILNINR